MKVGGSFSQSKHTDLGFPQEGVLSVTLFLVAFNGLLGELENGVDGWSDNIHYNKKSETDSQSPTGCDQQARSMGSR